MRITKVKELAEVNIDDGYPSAKLGWMGHIREAIIAGHPSTVITMEGVTPTSFHNWDSKNFQLTIRKV